MEVYHSEKLYIVVYCAHFYSAHFSRKLRRRIETIVFSAKSSVNFSVFVDKNQLVENVSNFTFGVLYLYFDDVSEYHSVKMFQSLHPRFIEQF